MVREEVQKIFHIINLLHTFLHLNIYNFFWNLKYQNIKKYIVIPQWNKPHLFCGLYFSDRHYFHRNKRSGYSESWASYLFFATWITSVIKACYFTKYSTQSLNRYDFQIPTDRPIQTSKIHAKKSCMQAIYTVYILQEINFSWNETRLYLTKIILLFGCKEGPFMEEGLTNTDDWFIFQCLKYLEFI